MEYFKSLRKGINISLALCYSFSSFTVSPDILTELNMKFLMDILLSFLME